MPCDDGCRDRVTAACLEHGLTMGGGDAGEEAPRVVPLTLQPFRVGRAAFDDVMRSTPLWNTVLDRVARDTAFVLATLEGSDAEFTDPMLAIYRDVYHNKPWPQETMLGVFRSDYMLADTSSDSAAAAAAGNPWKHVEINTIACAFAALSTRVGRVHRDALGLDVVVSDSEALVVDGLAAAHREWLRQQAAVSAPAAAAPVVVFVVQHAERNTTDQALLAAGLNALGVATVRLSIADLIQASHIDAAGRTVITPPAAGAPALTSAVDAPLVVSLFYFRSCYDLRDFPDAASWAMRRDIERSNAIKCPALPHHLCTWKRIQQALSERATLLKYNGGDAASADLLLGTMVGQHLLNQAPDAMRRAVARPGDYVLKTQKEGAGNIFVGDEMVALLEDALAQRPTAAAAAAFCNAHLLMERIHADRRPGSVLRGGQVVAVADLEAELGVFGTLLSHGGGGGGEARNATAGYLVRTKGGSSAGGGIMSGVAALDTVLLE
jgi:glutathione synthase